MYCTPNKCIALPIHTCIALPIHVLHCQYMPWCIALDMRALHEGTPWGHSMRALPILVLHPLMYCMPSSITLAIHVLHSQNIPSCIALRAPSTQPMWYPWSFQSIGMILQVNEAASRWIFQSMGTYAPVPIHLELDALTCSIGWLRSVGWYNNRSLLQNIVSCIGLFCKRDLQIYRSYWPKPPHISTGYARFESRVIISDYNPILRPSASAICPASVEHAATYAPSLGKHQRARSSLVLSWELSTLLEALDYLPRKPYAYAYRHTRMVPRRGIRVSP